MTSVSLNVVHKTLRATVADAVARGWVLDRTRRHFRLSRPGHGSVVFPKTPSDHRGVKNLQANIRRAERDR